MRHALLRTARVLSAFALAPLLLADPAAGGPKQDRKASPSGASAAAAAAGPRVQVAVDSLLDRRTTVDFPHSSLTLTLALQGDDAHAVKAVRPRVSRAVDDTGKSVMAPSETRSAFSTAGP